MENVHELIKKLLALSESPNEHEAAAAMAKAQELLLKYNIDMAEVRTTPGQTANLEAEMLNETVDFEHYQAWQGTLLNCIAKRNFCHCVQASGHVRILGRKANIRVIVELHNWCEPQIIRLAKATGYQGSEKNAYILGILKTLAERLDQQRAEFHEANPSSRALVVNIQGDSDDWFHKCYPITQKGRSVKITDAAAFSHGKQDGNKVSVSSSSRQVNGAGVLSLGTGDLPW